MEEYVYIDGKKYRRGYTTGSCAAGAAKAASHMLLTKKKLETVNIDTPKGIPLFLKVENIDIGENYVECSIKKDGGDDIDATHGIDIYARSEVTDSFVTIDTYNEKSLDYTEGIVLCGGKGVGIVTKKGLSVEVGQAAINPTPVNMIKSEVIKVIGQDIEKSLGKNKVLKITIFVPQGEEIAKKTFNPKLGIVGGISIIGTTGIVEPMSDEGWKKSISIELQMKKEQGLDKIILVPGNHGEQFIKEKLGLDTKYVVRTSNFIGYIIKEAQRMGYKKIFMAGHIGKFIKLSAGIFNTHSRVADARSEILVSNLALMKAPYSILEEISKCLTAEEAVDIIIRNGYEDLFNIISNKCRDRIIQHLNEDKREIDVEVMIFSMDKTLLGKSNNADLLVEEFR